jgi:hypothetical protein
MLFLSPSFFSIRSSSSLFALPYLPHAPFAYTHQDKWLFPPSVSVSLPPLSFSLSYFVAIFLSIRFHFLSLSLCLSIVPLVFFATFFDRQLSLASCSGSSSTSQAFRQQGGTEYSVSH